MNVLNIEECELLGDSKYRAYISQVEKALKSFENTSEWADLISALGKLNKVLVSHVKYAVIPKRVTIGKRLAQCLHPALPSGVHLKALETYDIIFKCVGTQRLAADLFTYCSGLFPLLGYAAMNVKPVLLAIYEKHFVTLGRHIRPGLTGLLLGLLPGLEEGSEHFERTNHLLEDFADAAEPTFFYGCLWECVLSVPGVRLAAINFVVLHFNRKQTMEDQLHFMGTNIDVLVEGLCSSIQDSSVLVQRSALDLLLIGFPMHNSQITRPDMAKLAPAAVKAVLRRDMSLNRRLYAWLMGTDASGNAVQVPASMIPAGSRNRSDSASTTSEMELGYFNMFSKELLVHAIQVCIRDASKADPAVDGKPGNLRPFRILISLLDKPEIGSAILEDVLIDIFRHMYQECEGVSSSENVEAVPDILEAALIPLRGRRKRDPVKRKEEKVVNSEIIKTANLLFGAFEPYFMWDYIARTFESVSQQSTKNDSGVSLSEGTRDKVASKVTLVELCKLIEFLLDKVALTDTIDLNTSIGRIVDINTSFEGTLDLNASIGKNPEETYPETQTEHLPELLRQVILALSAQCSQLTDEELTSGLRLCTKLLTRVLPSMIPVNGPRGTTGDSHFSSPARSVGRIASLDRYRASGVNPFESDEEEGDETMTQSQVSGSEDYLSADSDTGQEHTGEMLNVTMDPAKQETASFTDFVQYDEHRPDTFPRLPRGTPTGSPHHQRHVVMLSDVTTGESVESLSGGETGETLLQACVHCFQELFCTFVKTRILQDQEVATMLASQLHKVQSAFSMSDLPRVHVPPPSPKHRQQYSRMNIVEGDMSDYGSSSDLRGEEVRVLPVEQLSPELYEAFTCACQLLVDFSCFPMYCTNYQKALHPPMKKEKQVTFPDWLQLLLTCACFVRNFSIQQAAISTLLDLISLTQSLVKQDETSPTNGDDSEAEDTSGESGQSAGDGTVSVVMLPSLSPRHLKYLNSHTNFYRIVSTHLWNYLSEATAPFHQRSVDLLQQLHQLAPTPWVCEDVIGNALLSDTKGVRLSAHKKFAVLWHLLREKRLTTNPGMPIRTFDRSMFLMMDSLQSDVNPCRALTQTWLTHAIQRGDIARILEPVLLMLLHPDTARISIQHVNIHEPRKVRISESSSDADRAETKIYAISSEGGNIIYHVSNQGRPFSVRTTEELRTYALTTIAEGASGTRLTRPKGDMDLPFERVNPSDLNLRVNPFGSESSLDKVIFEGYEPPPQLANMQNVRRLTAETCKQQGIYFDDEQPEEDETEVAQEAVDALDEKKPPLPTEKVDAAKEISRKASQQETSKPVPVNGHAATGNITPEPEVEQASEAVAASETGTGANAEKTRESSQTPTVSKGTPSSELLKTNSEHSAPEAQSAEEAGAVNENCEEAEQQPKENVEEIVASILEGIISHVIRQEEERVVLQGTLESSSEPFQFRSEHYGQNTEQGSDKPDSEGRNVSSRARQEASAIDVHRIEEADAYSEADPEGDSSRAAGEEIPGIHPLHTHILLYTQKFDAQQTLYALTCLKAILTTTPRLVTCAMATTSISNVLLPHMTRLQHLLARHRRSVFGKNFFSEVPSDALSGYRSSMYVEIIISVSLYYIRSYYPNLMMSKLTEHELNGNKEVQILSCEILTLLLSELVNVAKDSGKGFSTYIGDLLSRCKVQKALLHCLLASVYNARLKSSNRNSQNLTEAIISFNEENMDANTNETFQIKLLKLVLVLILLEDQIRKAKIDQEGVQGQTLPSDWDKARQTMQPTLTSVRYVQSKPIVYQTMLLSAVLTALKQQHLSHMHRHWIAMVTSALPYLGRALSYTVVTTVNQLCHNLEILAHCYEQCNKETGLNGTMLNKVPPDHLIILLEGLTTLCHFCVLDAAQQDITIGQHVPTSSNNIVNDTATAGQILTNLIHVFNPYSNNREPSPAKEVTSMVPPLMEARRNLLSIFPRILASLTSLWKAINVSEAKFARDHKEQHWWTLGSPKTVRQYIIEFVSPISRHHGVNMLGAIAVVWNDRRHRRGASPIKKVIPPACPDQLLLVELVGAIKVLPTDTLMQTVRQVIKQPPATNLDKQREVAEERDELIMQESVSDGCGSENSKRTPLEVSMLQFFYAYMQRTPGVQLIDSWPSFLALLREGLQLSLIPPGQFLLLAILNEFVQKIPQFEERKDQKDLQDMTQKLLEACSEIASASLEQTTWLRRNLAVRPGPQVDVVDPDDILPDVEGTTGEARRTGASTEVTDRQYSVQALVMLADLVAPMLDVTYSSEEKDKVVPFLNNIMLRVFPYLRNHSPHNLPSFRACSQILANLSSYQYTRKTWRKEGFEMLLDTAFFQMDSASISCWHTVIDNLMTHDKTTFKDLLARVTVAPSSMNLFSSRDQEFENRAQLLKRFTYTIFCSEVDQYQKHMPDIQERLADSLRAPSVPSVQAQVFNCFRVLILRMSPQHLTSLWPTIITELVHVLLQIEQEMIPDVEESRTQLARMANLDTSWALGNGLCAANNNPSWLKLYHAACKLLDLALVLPTDVLPQFQLYRWAFVGDPGVDESDPKKQWTFQEQAGFIPHIVRINRLMSLRFGTAPVIERVSGRPTLTSPHLRAVQDLHGFFNAIISHPESSNGHFAASVQAPCSDNLEVPDLSSTMPKSKSAPEFRNLNLDSELRSSGSSVSGFGTTRTARQYIEYMVETDFLEPMPKPTC